MRIKIDKADQEFSYFIRLRDKECRRCGSKVTLNAKGMPNSHHASHYFGRGKESTRFDVENGDLKIGKGIECLSYDSWARHALTYLQYKPIVIRKEIVLWS